MGLRSFTEDLRAYFFGREREIQELYERVVHRPLTLLFSQSGLGKTSILKAGLIPRLREEGWNPVLVRLLHDPNAPTLEAQALAALHSVVRLPELPATTGLWQLFHDPALGIIDAQGVATFRPVLLFDQFEELFTHGQKHRPADVHDFLEGLACLVENRPPQKLREEIERDDALADRLVMGARACKVLITVRDDYLHALERSRYRMPSIMENRFELRLLAGPNACRAVYEPGALRLRAGGSLPIVAPATVQAIVRFVAGAAADVPIEEIDNVPPLLSLVCAQLNTRRINNQAETISFKALEESAPNVLRDFFEDSLAPHPLAVRHFVEDKLLSDSGFRESVTLDTALADLRRGGVAEPETALNGLVDQRLLVMEERGGVTRLEYTHDVLAPIAAASRQARMARQAQAEAERRLAEQRLKARQRAVLVAVMVLLTLFSVGGGMLTWKKSIEANRERAQAQEQATRAQMEASRAKSAEAHARELLRQASMAAYSTGKKAWQEDWDAEQRGERAETLGNFSKWHEAVAHLVRACELDPENLQAVSFLFDTVLHRGRLESPEFFCRVLRYEGTVTYAAFSPDGMRLVTPSDDKTARIWDAAASQPMGEPLRHNGRVRHAAFSPDGTRLVTASDDNTARVWDAATGRPLGEPLRHADKVNFAIFSPGGTRLVTASDDKSAQVWDTATGQPVGGPLRHGGKVRHVAFSPDGTRLITACDDKAARVWNTATGQQLGEPLRHVGTVRYVAFSPDGTRLATASGDQTAQIWDAKTGKPVGATLRHGGSVNQTTFSPDGTRLVTASDDRKARMWDPATGHLMWEPLKHEGTVNHAQFSEDGMRLVTSSDDYTARVWDAATGRPLSEPLRHRGRVRLASFSPDGTKLVTVSDDKTVRVWDTATKRLVGEPLRHPGILNHAAFSPDGMRLVTTGADRTAHVWDIATRRPVGEPLKHEGAVNYASYSPDGTRIVTASEDWTSRVWDAATGRPVVEPLRHEGTVNHVSFSADGTRLVTASDDKTARVWDAIAGRLVGEPLRHQGAVKQAMFSPDGTRLVTASRDGTARVWDTATGRSVGEPLQHEDTVNYAVFSPDGTLLATASDDQTARVWDAGTGHLISQLIGHEGRVNHAVFSLDGTRLITAGGDQTARVWDTATGRSVGEPLRHHGAVNHAVFSPDGKRLFTASDDKTVRVWSTLTWQALGEPLRHKGAVRRAEVNSDGTCLATVSGDETARVWEILPSLANPTMPAKDTGIYQWLSALAGLRLNQDGELNVIPFVERSKLPRDKMPRGASWKELDAWLAEPSGEWTLTMGNHRRVTEIAEKERDSGTKEGLLSALDLNPAVPLARLMLANILDVELTSESGTAADAVRLRDAWLRFYDLGRLPLTNAELWFRVGEILLRAPDAQVGIGPGASDALSQGRTAIGRGLDNARNLNFDPLARTNELLTLAKVVQRVSDTLFHQRQDWLETSEALTLADRIGTNLLATLHNDPDFVEMQQTTLANISWYRLLRGEFALAMGVIESKHKRYENNLVLDANRAHALLFLGRTAEAELLYRRHLGEKLGANDDRTWEQVVLDGFKRFEAAGRTHPEFARLRTLLRGN